jgi:hypothetical protein
MQKDYMVLWVIFISASAFGQTFTGPGNWSEAARWAPSMPGPTDNVIIIGNVR